MLTPKETGGRGRVHAVPIAHAALCEAGFSSSGPVAADAALALGWKPTAVDTAFPLCDPTHHYLLTIRKIGATVTVWKQDVELGSYATTAATYAELLVEALTSFAGRAKGYVSRLVVVEGGLDYAAFYQPSGAVPGLWSVRGLDGLAVHTLLEFADAVNLGADSSGNGNDWTLANGVQSVDTPTNNFATLNPLAANAGAGCPSDGLLTWNPDNGPYPMQSAFGLTGGKWYWEVEMGVTGVATTTLVGITAKENAYTGSEVPGTYAESYAFMSDGSKWENAAKTLGFGSNWAASGKVVQVYCDLDAGAIWYGVGGVLERGATLAEILAGDVSNAFHVIADPGKTFYPSCAAQAGSSLTHDFGQNGYAFAAPEGFLPLCDASRPDPAVLDPSAHYHVCTFVADPYGGADIVDPSGKTVFGNLVSAGGNGAAFDGDKSQSAGADAAYAPGETTGVIGLDLGVGNEAVWQGAVCTSTTNAGFWGQNNPAAMWLEMCGTNDDPLAEPAWTVLGATATFNDASADLGQKVIRAPHATPYRAYCVRIRSVDDAGLGPAIAEVEFSATVPGNRIAVGFDAENEDWLLVLKGLGAQPWYWVNTVCGLDRYIDPASTAGESVLPVAVSVSGNAIAIPEEMLAYGTAYSAMVLKVGPDTGFDIVAYTGDGGTPQMVDHSLGRVPFMYAVFGRSANSDKSTYWERCGAGQRIDLAYATGQTSGVWGNTAPTSTRFAVGGGLADSNAAGNTYVAFLFGRSAVIEDLNYTGNGSVDGPFCATSGVVERVEFLRARNYGYGWNNLDTARDPRNPVVRTLHPHDDTAEAVADALAMTSLGFKSLTGASLFNANGEEYLGLGLVRQSKYRNAF